MKKQLIKEPKNSIHETIGYIGNCAFWMKEYVEGRVNEERLIKTISSMKKNLEKLELLVFKSN